MSAIRSLADSGPKIRVWIDFVCPYCLLGESVLKEAISGKNVSTEWMPMELRPYPTPTLRPEGGYLRTSWETGVYPAARGLGIDIKLPTISPQPYTRLAFLGLLYAQDHSKGDEYVMAVLKAFFQEDLDIGDISVIETLMAAIGLPACAFAELSRADDFNDRYETLLQESYRLGVRAVPSIQIGNRIFPGLMPQADLRELITREVLS